MKFGLLLLYFLISGFASSVYAKDWPSHSTQEVKKYLEKNQACVYAWANVYIPPKNEAHKFAYKAFGYKEGYISQVSEQPPRLPNQGYPPSINHRTNVFCIFDAEYGAGINKTNGCTLAYYGIDTDSYESVLREKFGPIMVNGSSCDKKTTSYLLREFMIDLRPYYRQPGAWNLTNFVSPNPPNLPIEKQLIYDKFGIGLP